MAIPVMPSKLLALPQQWQIPITLLLVLLPVLSLLLITRSRSGSSANKAGPPGPPRLPVLGNLHQLGPLPHRSLRELARRHGPVMLLRLGTVTTVVVSSPEAAREVMKAHDADCCSRPESPGPRRLSYGCKDVAFAPYDDYWREVRKLFIVELLSMRRIKAAWHARQQQKALEDAATDHPEWTEKTIKQGDLLSRVFDPDRNGYVRSVGKGPTPGDLEMPGKLKYRSTKLQMAVEGHRQAKLVKEFLLGCIETMQVDSDRKIDALSQQVAEMKELLLANSHVGRHAHISPRYASNSPIHEDQHVEGDNVEVESNAAENMLYEETLNRHGVPSQKGNGGSGKEVVLYSIIGPHDIHVAKATVISTDRRTAVGGTQLGVECWEVVVNHVLKRAAQLPRPYGDMSIMADAYGRSIAWPHQHIKEDRKSVGPSQQAGRTRELKFWDVTFVGDHQSKEVEVEYIGSLG